MTKDATTKGTIIVRNVVYDKTGKYIDHVTAQVLADINVGKCIDPNLNERELSRDDILTLIGDGHKFIARPEGRDNSFSYEFVLYYHSENDEPYIASYKTLHEGGDTVERLTLRRPKMP